jgi:hypothetical protein
MPKKEETTTMLVRAVPLDVSEKIRRHCKREGIKYREFLKRAVDLLESPDRGDGQNQQQEKVNPLQRVNEIAERAKAYKNAIRLMKDLMGILQNLNFLTGWENQKHIYLEVVGMIVELSEIIREYIPKHEIPDDPKEMAAMGLPPELIYKMDLTKEEWQNKVRRDTEVAEQLKSSNYNELPPELEELRKKMQEDFQQFREADPEGSIRPRREPATPVAGEEQVQPESKAASTEASQEPKEEEARPRPKKA